MTFHLICVHISFSSVLVSVAEWPFLGESCSLGCHVLSLYFDSL